MNERDFESHFGENSNKKLVIEAIKSGDRDFLAGLDLDHDKLEEFKEKFAEELASSNILGKPPEISSNETRSYLIKELFANSVNQNGEPTFVRLAIDAAISDSVLPKILNVLNSVLEQNKELNNLNTVRDLALNQPIVNIQDLIDNSKIESSKDDLTGEKGALSRFLDNSSSRKNRGGFYKKLKDLINQIHDESTSKKNLDYLVELKSVLESNDTFDKNSNKYKKAMSRLEEKINQIQGNIGEKTEKLNLQFIASTGEAVGDGLNIQVAVNDPALCDQESGCSRAESRNQSDIEGHIDVKTINHLLQKQFDLGVFDFCLSPLSETKTCSRGGLFRTRARCKLKQAPKVVWNESEGINKLDIPEIDCGSSVGSLPFPTAEFGSQVSLKTEINSRGQLEIKPNVELDLLKGISVIYPLVTNRFIRPAAENALDNALPDSVNISKYSHRVSDEPNGGVINFQPNLSLTGLEHSECYISIFGDFKDGEGRTRSRSRAESQTQ